jgi:hypothetical protein
VIWFAVRDGGRQYMLREQDASPIRQAAELAATNRGVPLQWPSWDAGDRASLRFADVWGGFEAPLREASRRYASGPVIAANLAWNGNGWVGEWYLIDAGVSRHWVFDSVDYATVVNQGVGEVANELGRRYALLDEVKLADARRLRIEFDGVDTVQALKRVQRILGESPSVKAAYPYEVRDDTAIFDVFLRTDERDLVNRLGRHRALRALGTSATSAVNPDPGKPAQPNVRLADHRYQLLDEG